MKEYPYSIIWFVNDISPESEYIPKNLRHISIKRRFKLQGNIDIEFISNLLNTISFSLIKIRTNGFKSFKSRVKVIDTKPNPNLNILYQSLSTILNPYIITKDPEKEIGFDEEHKNAHITVSYVGEEVLDSDFMISNSTLLMSEIFLVEDVNESDWRIIKRITNSV